MVCVNLRVTRLWFHGYVQFEWLDAVVSHEITEFLLFVTAMLFVCHRHIDHVLVIAVDISDGSTSWNRTSFGLPNGLLCLSQFIGKMLRLCVICRYGVAIGDLIVEGLSV